MFIAIGHKPNTDLFKDQLDLDANGYIKTVAGTAQRASRESSAAGTFRTVYRQAVTLRNGLYGAIGPSGGLNKARRVTHGGRVAGRCESFSSTSTHSRDCCFAAALQADRNSHRRKHLWHCGNDCQRSTCGKDDLAIISERSRLGHLARGLCEPASRWNRRFTISSSGYTRGAVIPALPGRLRSPPGARERQLVCPQPHDRQHGAHGNDELATVGLDRHFRVRERTERPPRSSRAAWQLLLDESSMHTGRNLAPMTSS